MLNLLEEYYKHENAFANSVISREKFDRMAKTIRGAFEDLIPDIDAAVIDIKKLKVAVEQ